MKSRLITALAIGALAAGMLPGVASAANPDQCIDRANMGSEDPAAVDCADYTQVNVSVTEGTTLYVPAAIQIDSGFPGETVQSDSDSGVGGNQPYRVNWFSNQDDAVIKATLTDFSSGDVGETIANDDAMLSVNGWAGGTQNMGSTVDVATVVFNGETDEITDHQDFALKVRLPSAAIDDYNADLAWSVVPFIP